MGENRRKGKVVAVQLRPPAEKRESPAIDKNKDSVEKKPVPKITASNKKMESKKEAEEVKEASTARMEDVRQPVIAKNPFAKAGTSEKAKSIFSAFSETNKHPKRSSNK